MDTQESLRQTVADFFQVCAGELTPEFSLIGPRLNNSIGRYALDAAIRRRVGIRCAAIHSAKTFGELIAEADEPIGTGKNIAFNKDDLNDQPQYETSSNTSLLKPELPITCGVDLQSIDELPFADDYWEHDFYSQSFSPSEIAYCVAQQDPRQHFAARWCAKEALKKCMPQLLDMDMNRFEVVHEESGMPTVWERVKDEKVALPVSLSISHTEHLAIAFVTRSFAARQQKSMNESAPVKSVEPTHRAASKIDTYASTSGFTKITFVISILSLALAVLALALQQLA